MTKVIRILLELMAGLLVTANTGRSVTVFGSARTKPGSRYYNDAVQLANRLSPQYTVITGGGPGIMEAANKGAYLAGGPSIGCSIQLPMEASINEFTSKRVNFKRFFIRKFIMTRISDAFVVFPGGYGTMDELFEILTLVQCLKQNKPVKIVLYGAEFWKGLVNWMDEVLCAHRTIDRKDLFIFTIADSVEEAAQYILDGDTISSDAIPALLS